ncbi:C6 zinc finger domain protein [Ilyonectria robusta]
MLSNGFGSGFWERFVIQTAHANAAIFRSIVALSTLLEDVSKWQMSWAVGLQAPVNETTKSALGHYGMALRQLSDHPQGSQSMNIISLTSCLLFSCIESLVGNLRGSENLTTAGLKILSQTEPANICLESSGPLKSFLPVFMRMDSFFVQRTLSPKYQPPFTFQAFRSVPSSFSSLSEATYYLDALINMSHRLGDSARDPSALQLCRGLYERWNSAFRLLLARQVSHMDKAEGRNLCLCHVWRLDTHLTLFGPQEGELQVAWDSHEPSFRELLSYASSLSGLGSETDVGQPTSFSLGGGIFFPLARLGFRCRDPCIRRAVISLLSRHSQAEGPLLGPIAARILKRIVAVEEFGLGEVSDSSDVPEQARVTSVSVRLRGKGNGAGISYSRLMSSDSGLRVTVYDVVL